MEFTLGSSAKTEIAIYNMMGVKMKTVLAEENLSDGKYSLVVETASLPAGNYLIRMISGAQASVVTMNVVH
ncbi:MAG: T9SS type A sorting domain-containing protein [Bacteroidetes bacterium]|nr:T9SS type A sorting domain-containing protein [Bacteroidota bacterium]